MANNFELTCGKQRGGKNVGQEDFVLDWIGRGLPAVLLLPHEGDWDVRIVALILSLFGGQKLWWHKLKETSRVFPLNFWIQSQHPDPWQRRMENQANAAAVMEMIAHWRGVKWSEHPLIDEVLYYGLQLLLQQHDAHSLGDLGRILYPEDKFHKQLLATCTEDETFSFWRSIPRGRVAERKELGGARRAFREVFGDVAFSLRDSNTSFFDESLHHGHVHVFSGTENQRSTSVLFNLVKYKAAQFVRNRYFTTGRPFPLLILIDEAVGLGMIRRWDVDQVFQQMAKMGLFVRIIAHSPNFGDPQLNEDVLQFMDCVRVFGCGSDTIALKLAKLIRTRAMDFHRVHHFDEQVRVVQSGYEEIEERSRRVGKTDDTTITYRKRPKMVERVYRQERYMDPDDIFLEDAGKLMCAPVGACFVADGANVYWKQVKMRPEPWAWKEMTAMKVDAFYREMLTRPEFVTPSLGGSERTLSSPSSQSIRERSIRSSNGVSGSESKNSDSPATKRLLDALKRSAKKRGAP